MASRNRAVWPGIHTMTGDGRRSLAAHSACFFTVVSLRPCTCLPRAAQNASSRGSVHASSFGFRAAGSSTPAHGDTAIIAGTALLHAARNGANIRATRAGDSGRGGLPDRAASIRRSISVRWPDSCPIRIISPITSATCRARTSTRRMWPSAGFQYSSNASRSVASVRAFRLTFPAR